VHTRQLEEKRARRRHAAEAQIHETMLLEGPRT